MKAPGKILIIDDDARNIFALSATLRAKGYDVVSAQDAADGFAALERDNMIRIILMDIMMPYMDGYEAMAHIRNRGETSKIPIIAITAQAMKGDRELSIKAGADAYVSKPIDVDLLLKYLQQYLK